MSIDMTAANDAALEAAPFAYPDDVVFKIVAAAAPFVEAAVREQIAQDITAMNGNALLKGLVAINPTAEATVQWAAAVARGDE